MELEQKMNAQLESNAIFPRPEPGGCPQTIIKPLSFVLGAVMCSDRYNVGMGLNTKSCKACT